MTEIKTLQDIADATTPENIDNFLKDLKVGVLTYYALRKQDNTMKFDQMNWIDDNNRDYSFRVRFRHNPKGFAEMNTSEFVSNHIVSTRLKNLLLQHPDKTVGEVYASAGTIRNFGKKSVEELEQYL